MLTYVGSLSLKGIHSGINFLCARSPFPLTLILERRSSATLAFHGGQCRVGTTAPGRLGNGCVDLTNLASIRRRCALAARIRASIPPVFISTADYAAPRSPT